MKNINQIFKSNPYLKDETEVKELISYCQELEEELFELRPQISKNNHIQTDLTEFVQNIQEDCREMLRERRIFEDEVDFRKGVENLKEYAKDFCRRYKIC